MLLTMLREVISHFLPLFNKNIVDIVYFKSKIFKNGKKRPGDSSYIIMYFFNFTRFPILKYCCKCVFL